MPHAETSRSSHGNPRRAYLLRRGGHMVLKELFQRSAAGVRPSYGGHPARLDEYYAPRDLHGTTLARAALPALQLDYI